MLLKRTSRLVNAVALPTPSSVFRLVESNSILIRFLAFPIESKENLIGLEYSHRKVRLGKSKISLGTEPARLLLPRSSDSTVCRALHEMPNQSQMSILGSNQ